VTAAPLLIGIDSHGAEADGEGNATYIRNLIAALYAMQGDEAYALMARDPGHPFYRGLPQRGRSRAIGVRQGAGLLRIAFTLGRAAARQGVDCLHVQYAAPLGWRGSLVATIHDLGFIHVPASFPAALRLALRVLVPWSIARASTIITSSEFCRRDIEARYRAAAGKVVTIPLAAAPHFAPRDAGETAAVLARYGLAPGFVFSLGRLNRRKNLERLLLAHARLRTDGVTDVPLVIGGKLDFGGEDVEGRAKLSTNGSNVRLVGLIPDDDLPHFYGGAGCFVYPSIFEGFGLPLVEAMACGTPVVGANRTALPELIEDAGLVVDPESVDAIASAMARLLTDRALAADHARRGIERSRRYSWSETARRTLSVYRDAVASR